MTSSDFHLRNLIQCAKQKRSLTLVDDAFALVEAHWDRFGSDFAPELLVLFAEAASEVGDREAAVFRALSLYDRLKCQEDQFKVRALLVRFVYEVRLGTAKFCLKGFHALQQFQYALRFHKEALSIATRAPFDSKYGFLVYNASLVFWEIVRPMCRAGWQKHVVAEILQVLEAVKLVRSAGFSAPDPKGGKGGAAIIPVSVDAAWIAELALCAAFALEDAGRDADAAAKANEAISLLEELRGIEIKEAKEALDVETKKAISPPTDQELLPHLDQVLGKAEAIFGIWSANSAAEQAVLKSAKDARALLTKACSAGRHPPEEAILAKSRKAARLRGLALSAKAYFARKQGPGKTRDEIDAASGSTVLGTVLFVQNRGIPPEQAEEELIKAWMSVDKEFNLREAKQNFNPKAPPQGGPSASALTTAKRLELAAVARAACQSERWEVAQPMVARLETFQIPLGRGRILVDLCKAEVSVHQAINVKMHDPISKMLLTETQQAQREVDARVKAVLVCEQCAMAGRRIDEADLVEDAAVVLYRLAHPLLCDEHRKRIHRSLQRCADLLEEIQSIRLAQLRVQLHMEVARGEIEADLLNKGMAEFQRAAALDYTAADSELPEAAQKRLAEVQDLDPAPYVRPFEPYMEAQMKTLHWKTSLLEEATTDIDKVGLLLDQMQRQTVVKASSSIAPMRQGYLRLKAQFDELLVKSRDLSGIFTPPSRVITSAKPLTLLEHRAPATISPDGPSLAEVMLVGQAAPKGIQDRRHLSPKEDAMAKLKQIVALLCRIGTQAHRCGEISFALDVCRTVEAIRSETKFGPAPIEVDGALLLAEAAYTKALCLDKRLEELGVNNGIDDEIEEEQTDAELAAAAAAAAALAELGSEAGESEFGAEEGLSAEQKKEAVAQKKELIKDLLYGMEKSCEFKQWWMVTNGLVHWWNLHLNLLEEAAEKPKVLLRTLQEYRDGLAQMQKYFSGPPETHLPDAELNKQLAAGLLLAHVETAVANGNLSVLEVDKLLALKRFGAVERKQVMARVAVLLRQNNKPVLDITKLRPDRLEGAVPADPKKVDAKKGVPAAPVPCADKSDLHGAEVEIMLALVNVTFETTADAAMKSVERAKDLLNGWEPKQDDEGMLTLWTEMWTRLGRQCLKEPVNAALGRKYALMCGTKALGKLDAPIPKYSSRERLWWRGACHALCGEAFNLLIDPQRQEKGSLMKLRQLSAEQYEWCCMYAAETKDQELAVCGATSLWNVALPLLESPLTRQQLVEPLKKAAKALGVVRYKEEPFFFVGLYVSLFECYKDREQWDDIHAMLNEAFLVIPSQPSTCHRRLWSLRMLALSRQGKNVTLAMGQMKESQAKAQAGIWILLAHASSKVVDQMEGYSTAIQILHAAEQPEVVELRIEFADWLIRNRIGAADAREQLACAADMLLEIEDCSDEEEEDDDGNGSKARSRSSVGRRSQKSVGSKKSKLSRRSSRSKASGAGSRRRASKSSKSALSAKSSLSVAAKAKKMRKAEEDEAVLERLFSHHYDQLLRVYVAESSLCPASEMHQALLAAVHFATRFFSSTADLANGAAQQLATILPKEAPSTPADGSVRLGQLGAMQVSDETPITIIKPILVMPSQLWEWALEDNWSWFKGKAIVTEVLTRAQQYDIVPKDSTTWAGHEDAFPKPSLSFYALNRLEQDLADQALHLWAFPVLAMHRQLAEDLTDGHLRTAMLCLVHLKTARYASECRLLSTAAAATSQWRALLPVIPESFASFEEMLELVRSQRAGRPPSAVIDPDWVQRGDKAGFISAAWSRGELQVYEVWVELARECRRHGEQFAACQLAAEALEHATAFGDGRALRSVHLLQAGIAYDEGRYSEVVAKVKLAMQPAPDRRAAADAEQTAELAMLLADTYQAVRQPVIAGDVLNDAWKALHAEGAGGGATTDGRGDSTNALLLKARCAVQTKQVELELQNLVGPSPSFIEWLQKLEGCLQRHIANLSALRTGAQHSSCLTSCMRVVEAVERLLETKTSEIVCEGLDALASISTLASVGKQLCESFSVAQASKDTLLTLGVPIEGMQEGAVSTAEVLAARFDVRYARALSLKRHLVSITDALAVAEVAREHAGKLKDNRVFTGVPDGRLAQGTYRKEEDLSDFKAAWEKDITDKIDEVEGKKREARRCSELESSMAMLSGAFAVLQKLSERPAGAAPAEVPELAPATTEALTELGRVQLELAAAKWAVGKLQDPGFNFKEMWEDASSMDWREAARITQAERCSNVLQARDPAVLFSAPVLTDAAGGAGASDVSGGQDLPALPHREVAASRLCAAAKAALESTQFRTARRSLKAFAVGAYGVTCSEATFEGLVFLQSVDVCLLAEEAFQGLLAPEHQEAIQTRLLLSLEATWSVPRLLGAHRSTTRRLQHESPTFQRFRLADLPPVTELLMGRFPPLTLVVTLQVHDHKLYIGAACSPPETVLANDPTPRREQLRHFVARISIPEMELHAVVRRLNDVNSQIEQEMISTIGNVQRIPEKLEAEYAALLSEADAFIGKPVAARLMSLFWEYGTGIEHPRNPRHLLLLPDKALWNLPLERFDSFLRLFGPAPGSGMRPNYGVVTRDLSFHLAAQRVARAVEDPPAGAEPKALPPRVPSARPDSTALMADAFNEDELKSGDSAGSEVMSATHKRLCDAKLVGSARHSLNGNMFQISPADVKLALADSTAFYSLGFGRFFNLLSSAQFAAQDLRHVGLLCLFHHALNYGSFRRHVKAESSKTPLVQSLETPYFGALLAAFRGVQCTVLSVAPIPAAVILRVLELFLRSMQAGKTASASLEEALACETKHPELRWARPVTGGLLPGGFPLSDVAPASGVAPAKGTTPAPSKVSGEAKPAEWLGIHTRAAFSLVGAPWVVAEAEASKGQAPTGKKK